MRPCFSFDARDIHISILYKIIATKQNVLTKKKKNK